MREGSGLSQGGNGKGPRDVWGRSAGAPRSLLSLWVLPRRREPTAGRMLGARSPRCQSERSAREDVAPERDGEHRPQPFDVVGGERIVLVRGEVGLHSRFEPTLLLLDVRDQRAPEREQANRFVAGQSFGGVM